MAITEQQCKQVDNRVEYVTINNSLRTSHDRTQHTVNVRAAIRMAFVLGTRFGIAHPLMAGDYMDRWLKTYLEEDEVDTGALRHQTTMMDCILPITHYVSDDEGQE